MSAVLSKSSLARVTSKAATESSRKKPEFSHNRSVEMDRSGSVPHTVAHSVGLSLPLLLI